MAAELSSEPLLTAAPPSNISVSAGDGAVLQEAVRVATSAQLPLELGSIEVTEDGRVAPSAGGRPLTFSFYYRGLPFAGEVGPQDGATLRLVGEFGKLPFTAEMPQGRRAIRNLVAESQRNPRIRFLITRAQDIRLAMEVTPPKPRTPVGLVAAVAALLLEAQPATQAMTALLSTRFQPTQATTAPVAANGAATPQPLKTIDEGQGTT